MSWWKHLSRKKIKHPNPVFFYTVGEQFNGGAEQLAFDTEYLRPLQGIGGIVHGNLRVLQPPQVYQSLALPVQPLIAGVQAGALQLQGLNTISNDEPVQ